MLNDASYSLSLLSKHVVKVMSGDLGYRSPPLFKYEYVSVLTFRKTLM